MKFNELLRLPGVRYSPHGNVFWIPRPNPALEKRLDKHLVRIGPLQWIRGVEDSPLILDLKTVRGIAKGMSLAIYGKGPSEALFDTQRHAPEIGIYCNHAAQVRKPDELARRCFVVIQDAFVDTDGQAFGVKPPAGSYPVVPVGGHHLWPDREKFVYNPAKKIVPVDRWDGASLPFGPGTIHPALYLAAVMEPEEIYLVGCDADESGGKIYSDRVAMVIAPGRDAKHYRKFNRKVDDMAKALHLKVVWFHRVIKERGINGAG